MYQNLKRYRAYQIICCKATSLCEIMSREDKMTNLSNRALKQIFIGSKYSLNIAQDPTYPSIWKYLSRNIFDHQRNSFLSNVPGGQNGKVYQCDSLVTLGKLDIKIHQDQSHRSHHCCHRPAHRVLQHKRTSPPGSQGFPPWFQDCIISRILAM